MIKEEFAKEAMDMYATNDPLVADDKEILEEEIKHQKNKIVPQSHIDKRQHRNVRKTQSQSQM